MPAYTLNLIFRNVTSQTEQFLKAHNPLHFKQNGTAADITIQRSHQEILEFIGELDRNHDLVHFEVHTADLEDVFIDLLSKQQKELR